MASQDGGFTSRAHLSNGTNCAFWKVRMRAYLMFLGVDFWYAMVDGYKESETPLR